MSINPGQGTTLSIGSAVTQVLEVDGPETTVEPKETTNLASVVKSYRMLIPDGGTASCRIQYDPTVHHTLTTLINAYPQVAQSCTVTFNDAGPGAATFSAFLSRFKATGMNQEDNLEAEIDLKINGLVTWPLT